VITTASASIFWESIIGSNISEILEYNIDYIVSLIWEISPKRKHAATLALLATRNAIHKYLNDGVSDDFSDVLE
jgi:NifU-like protein involved in Fe-S cluster formation